MQAAERKFQSAAFLPQSIIMDAVSVCEKAAIAAAQVRGQGNEKHADQVAVDAMRRALNELPMRGLVVIGEGERDEAPMLYIGEAVGQGTGPAVDIALDPLEGTTICAKNMPGSLATAAFATEGGFLYAPDVYMQKLAVGPDVPEGLLDINAPVADTLAKVAKAKGRAVSDLAVCVLDRPRHEQLIKDIRATGARINLIGDGDVAGVIAVANPDNGVDVYMGSGGAPEGVLAAAGLRCVGGQIQGKLLFRNDDEKARATKIGVTDFNRVYQTTDLARGHVVFCAAGVTTGALLSGVQFKGETAHTSTLVMDSATRTVRIVETQHPSYVRLSK